MAEGTIDFQPEQFDCAEAWLPNGVLLGDSEQYGGVIRAAISGNVIEAGKGYQLVVVNEPLKRTIELKKNPNQGA